MPDDDFESKHPRATDGKFGSGSGEHERTEASLKDPAFVGQHMNRLIGAADKVRAGSTLAEQGTDAEHARAQAAIHHEASLIHHEDDATSGPHEARLKEALAEARSGGSDHAATMAHLASVHQDAEAEHAAIAAGYVDPSHEALAPVHEFLAARDAANAESSAAAAELLTHNDLSAEALHAFRETDSALEEHDDRHRPLEGELHEDLESTAQALDSTHEGHGDFADKHPAPEVRVSDHDPDAQAPAREEFESVSDFRAAVSAHENGAAEHADFVSDLSSLRAEHAARADKAQTALEALHEKQHATLDAFRDRSVDKLKTKADNALGKIEDKGGSDVLVNHAAFAQHTQHEDPESGYEVFTSPEIQAQHERAQQVAASVLERLSSKVEGDESEFGTTDQIDAIKEAAKSTGAAIRHLSKITGRAPKFAGKAKKSNRPGAGTSASVASMARYKLKLSKLDFVSLVDQPAQATATCRLIKRAGGGTRMQTRAVAQLLKVADGPNPLAYFWAFTCTGEDGQPYHDLQGDAIEPDAYIKAAEDFMSTGGAVDEMHDSRQTGRVAFAFPMDSDIAKAMFGAAAGDLIKTSGLMVAMRPTADQVAKLRSGELTGVSIAGNGIRQLAKKMPAFLAGKKKPKRYGKSITLTSETDGHAHTVDLDAPADSWSDMLSTSCQTAEGATETHSHAWVYDATSGAITIAADSGHSHTVDAVVSAETMAEAAADEDDEDDAVPCGFEDEPSSGKTVVVAVSARAPVSTPGAVVPTVKTQEQSMPTPEEKIAEIEKRAARFEKMSTLTDAARLHFGKLAGNEAEAFLAKSTHEREIVLAEIAKADEVVHTSLSGRVFRKSDSLDLITMAKQLDELTVSKQKAESEARDATFAKRGDEVLKNFPVGAKKNLRARFMKALNTEFADPAEYEEAVQALKGHDNAVQMLGVAKGVNPANDGQPESPAVQLQQLVKRHATENKVTEAAAYVAVLDTAEGARLYAQQPVGRA